MEQLAVVYKTSHKDKLDERAFKFVRAVRFFIKGLPRTLANNEDVKQLVRSTGNLGAHCLELEQASSKRDYMWALKVLRREAKEIMYWLDVVDSREHLEEERESLVEEASALFHLFDSLVLQGKHAK